MDKSFFSDLPQIPADCVCQYCNKKFRSEKTLSAHMCTKKKRFLEKDTVGARIGLAVFQQFYQQSTNAKTVKTVTDFINSRYYLDFVKFGRHVVDLNPISTPDFVSYLIKNSVSLSDWCKDVCYDAYLLDYVKREPVEKALERTILEISNWAERNNEQLQNFFNKVGVIEAIFLIKSGKISPWVLYLAPSAGGLWDRITPEEEHIISNAVNPDIWSSKFKSQPADVAFVKNILQSSGF